MRTSQLIVRIVVFCCVALTPSDDGSAIVIAILLGIVLGLVVGFFDVKTGLIPREEKDVDSNRV